MIPLIVVRPQPGAATTLAAALELGLPAAAFPLFEVHSTAWSPVSRTEVDAVLLGSANALRLGGRWLDELRGLPAYCVGETTAKAAESAGFPIARVGRGGLQQVVDQVEPRHRRLLRLAAAAHVPLSPPHHVELTTRIVYEAAALPMPIEMAAMLRSRCVVMLHSGEAARHLAALCDEAGIDRATIALATIGPRVAQLAGDGWLQVRSAASAGDAALLALAAQMCQDLAEAP